MKRGWLLKERVDGEKTADRCAGQCISGAIGAIVGINKGYDLIGQKVVKRCRATGKWILLWGLTSNHSGAMLATMNNDYDVQLRYLARINAVQSRSLGQTREAAAAAVAAIHRAISKR